MNTPSAHGSNNGFDWRSPDAFLFDIDGTLLNTKDLVHYNALNRAMLEAYGIETTIDGVAFHGMTDLGILRAALHRVGVTSEIFAAKLPYALDIVRQHVAENAPGLSPSVCCGIPDLVRELREQGKLLGVASGNLESVGWHKIASAGLREFFAFGCFSDECEMRTEIFQRALSEVHRRLGELATVCFVGDTPEDIRAARAVGAQVIAVGTGIYKSVDLASLEPDLYVDSCAQLSALDISSHSEG